MDYKWTPEEKKVVDGLQFELEYAKRNNLASARVPRGMLEKGLNMLESQQERIAIISEGEKHGHWIGDSYGYTCSACGKNMAEIADSDDYTFYKTSAYCPFCGAMMDEPPKEG